MITPEDFKLSGECFNETFTMLLPAQVQIEGGCVTGVWPYQEYILKGGMRDGRGSYTIEYGKYLPPRAEPANQNKETHVHYHFHPGNSQTLSAVKDIVKIEPAVMAAQRAGHISRSDAIVKLRENFNSLNAKDCEMLDEEPSISEVERVESERYFDGLRASRPHFEHKLSKILAYARTWSAVQGAIGIGGRACPGYAAGKTYGDGYRAALEAVIKIVDEG